MAIARALAKEPEQRYASCRELARAALAVAADEAGRRVVDAASRAAVGRGDLSEVEAELAGKVLDLQLVHEQARALAGPATPARVASEGLCPFKGLASFEPVDTDYFFGRERLVAELVTRLVGAGFLGIVGPSGSGKSSVLRAGLLPALAGGVLPGSERWRRVLFRPGDRPLDELRRMLASGAQDPVAEALDALGTDERILLAVDQLEELFTAGASDADRTTFVEAIVRAAADPHGRAIVAVALRADFYGRFAAYGAFAELLGGNHVLVGPMQASELRRAVELPAGRVGLRAEPGLTDALVDDVEGEPGALPLLSTALLELWQKRQDNTLTLAAYRESGGVHGAVARLAEGTYARISDDRRPLVRALMLRLVGEGEGDASVRRRAPLGELDLERNEDVADVLATLADSRLVTVSEGNVEVAHEALLREWPRLREWIEEDTEGRRLRRHITQAATDWNAAGRDRGELYRGARLAAALDWTADHALDVNELEREFVTESREASEKETKRARRTNRRLRGLLAGVAVMLAAAVAGGIFAAIQRSEARDAETGQLAQRLGAQALVKEDLDLSLLLARQAVAIDDSPQTRGYLLDALLGSPKAIGIMHARGDNGFARGIAVSPDGKTLAVAESEAAGLLFFDARTYEQIGEPVPGTEWVESVAYSPEGKTLAVGGYGHLRLLDARTRKQLAEVRLGSRVGLGTTRVAFTSDGSQLAVVESVAESHSWITIRDAATLERIGSRIKPEGFTGLWISQLWADPSIALTPDGRSLVTTSVVGELTWWDLQSREKTRTLEIADGYRALALSPDGRTAAIGLDRGIQLIHQTGEVQESTGALTEGPIWLVFSPDAKTVVSTSRDGTVTLWDVSSMTPRETLRGHSAAVQQPVFSPDGKTLYTASHDGSAIAWDVYGNRGLGRPLTFTREGAFDPHLYRHPGTFSPDGRLVAVGLSEHGIRLWNADELTPAGAPLLETGGEVMALAFSPDGRTLAAGTANGKATVWDVESRSLRHGPFDVTYPTVAVASLSFSADGKTLATAGPDSAKLWDVATGAPVGVVGDEAAPAGDAGAVAFSPTGPLLALVHAGWRQSGPVEGGGDVEIWDVARGSLVRKLRVDAPGLYPYVLGFAVAFSPDGGTLATAGIDPLVHLWDVETGKLIREFKQNVSGVLTLEFTPDGSMLAISGYGEPFASLRDVATGAQIGPKLRAGSHSAMVDVSPDGQHMLQTYGSGEGAVWNIDPASWLQRACTLANRTLTREEWDEFLPGRRYEPACR